MKTFTAKPADALKERRWLIIDAAEVPLGRLGSTVAHILRGKHKPTYTPHVDTGDHVIVINARKVAVTGNKLDQKRHYWHTGYPGGMKSVLLKRELETHPDRVIRRMVKGMLPRGVLGRAMLSKLRVYPGTEHPHEAQQPIPIAFDRKKFIVPRAD